MKISNAGMRAQARAEEEELLRLFKNLKTLSGLKKDQIEYKDIIKKIKEVSNLL